MASHQGNNTHSESAKTEQIITEFFPKSLHIILESRCPFVSSRNYSGEQVLSSPSSSSSSSSSVRPRDKWFNLALRECPAALENIDFWRQSNIEPMVIDVILVQRSSDWGPVNCSPGVGPVRKLSLKERSPSSWSSEHDEYGFEATSEKIIERWVLQYEIRKTGKDVGSGSKRSSCTSSNLYKKSILVLRSLYVTTRLLPAYKLFRDLNSSGQIQTFNLAHRVSSFAEPFSRNEEAEMQRFVFSPLDTTCGRLSLSVFYRSSLFDVSSEPSTPMSPQVIPDYVGSPMADPLRRFPSLTVPQGYSSPFERRHSWSYDFYRPSPPSAFPSPSPTYSDSRASVSKPNSNRLPPSSLPRHLFETPHEHKKNTSFDEYWPSLTFSISPSSSPPPTYIPGSHMSKVLLRSESAPVKIPASKLANAPSLSKEKNPPPSSPFKGTRPSSSKTDRSSLLIQTSSTVEKLLSFTKDDGGKYSGVKMSCDSTPWKSISRSSSRLSFQDDFDDSEFPGHFVVDDEDMADPGSRPDSFDQKHQRGSHEPGGIFPVKKSKGAAVGALVHMFKNAPPLCQDLSNSTKFVQQQPSRPETRMQAPPRNELSVEPRVPSSTMAVASSSSALAMSKTMSDALEELRGYREMKDLLLRQAGRSSSHKSME